MMIDLLLLITGEFIVVIVNLANHIINKEFKMNFFKISGIVVYIYF